jgi:hypothetical protein
VGDFHWVFVCDDSGFFGFLLAWCACDGSLYTAATKVTAAPHRGNARAAQAQTRMPAQTQKTNGVARPTAQ